jgi:hypothetical protein
VFELVWCYWLRRTRGPGKLDELDPSLETDRGLESRATPLGGRCAMAEDEQITPYDGPTDLDMLGNRQPIAAGALEDVNPEAHTGEELPDQEGGTP